MRKRQLNERLEFALQAAEDAGELILRYFQAADLDVEVKHDKSPVTAADRGAEQLLRDLIERQFPDDGVLGEEMGGHESAGDYRWILDPIDGTQSFVHGVPLFGTLVALEYKGEVVLGVCRFPALHEVVYAARGMGAWWKRNQDQPQPAAVSAIDQLSDALFCTTTVTGWGKIDRCDVFEQLCSVTGLTRGWGDCYGHILVATGRAEVMVDPELSVWDAAALLPIIEEAGGHFIDWNGRASIATGNGISVNAALKDRVLALTRDA